MNLRLVNAALLSSALCAQVPFDGPAGEKVKLGHALLDQGKFQEAGEAFGAAQQLDGSSCWPLSGLARLFQLASQRTDAAHVSEYRDRAESYAHQALELNDLDYIAMEVLKRLNGGREGSTFQPTAKAEEAFKRAEVHFQGKHFEEAIKAYDEALAVEPKFTDAWLYKGDCYFMQEAYDEAMACFTKATDLEPGYARAWRFRADCYARLGQLSQASGAALQGLLAEPDDYTAWARYRQVRARQGVPQPERMIWPKVRSAKVNQKANGEISIAVSQAKGESPEAQAAGVYEMVKGIGEASVRGESSKKGDLPLGPFARELAAWEAALNALEAKAKEQSKPVKDKAWLKVLAFQKAGCLPQALFLLRFRESYRSEYEAWRKAHPEGLQDFMLLFQVRP